MLMRTMQRWLAVSVLALPFGPCWGQAGPPLDPGIYTCKDDQGHAITRDRYIEECRHKEQRLLNKDGSLRRVLPPTLTADERAQRESAEQARREAEAARNDAIKYDRNLLKRYPDKATHDKERASALGTPRLAIQSAEARLQELAVERRRLLDEAEFYRGRRVPSGLKQQLDNNEAAAEAQRNAIRNAQAEVDRINAKFDTELARLRKLWGDAQPGSLGPPPQ
jgi:hypothetical protein